MNTNVARQGALYHIPNGRNGIHYYENDVPDFVVDEMDRCYGALFSSVRYLRLAGTLSASTCTYVAFSDSEIRSIFLLEREGPVVRVLNGAIRTEQEEVGRFADYIFGRMPDIERISFPGVHMQALETAYPYQRFFAGEDIVVSFAGTPEDYERQLGKNTRKSIKRHAAALRREHPASCYRMVAGTSVDVNLTNLVVKWNRQRMSDKSKVSSYGDEDARRMTALAAGDGMIGTVVIENRIRAGTVCCRVGDTCYLTIMGHDSDYSAFSPGLLCNYWTTLECLRMQCKEINLMGGRLPYKYSFLGESRRYDSLVMYRNRAALSRNIREVARTALAGYTRQAKFAILDCERKEGRIARLVASTLNAWRACRRTYRSMTRKASVSIHCTWMTMAMEVGESVPLL